MPLTNIAIQKAKVLSKAYKLFDSNGLFLWVKPTGGKLWRFKYRFAGKEKLLALGTYPAVGLAKAREDHAAARRQLAAGVDPGLAKREAKRTLILDHQHTFEAVGREWHQANLHRWDKTHGAKILTFLEANIFPKLRGRPMRHVTAPELLDVLRAVEKRGALHLTRKLSQYCSRIFSFAIATGRAERNPVGDLLDALKTPTSRHMPHLGADDLPEFFSDLSYYQSDQTKRALKFLMLTMTRTSEVRRATWKEIDFDKAVWRIPADRMKMRDPHIVPLARQTLTILREQREISGKRPFVFPNENRPHTFISENTLLYALYRMGYRNRATVHGFRATASTVLNEHGFPPDVIERQLAHCERDQVRAAYNHAQYLDARTEMMQWWADFLETAAGGTGAFRPLAA